MSTPTPDMFIAARILETVYGEVARLRWRPVNINVSAYADHLRETSRNGHTDMKEYVYYLIRNGIFAFGKIPKEEDRKYLQALVDKFFEDHRDLFAELEICFGGVKV